MATKKDFHELTEGMSIDTDCPLCGMSWPMCHGLCIAHESMNGMPGPFHTDYNDDCEECQKEFEGFQMDQEEPFQGI